MNLTRRGFLKLLGAAALLPAARALPAPPEPVLALVEAPAGLRCYNLNDVLREVYSTRVHDLIYLENAFLKRLGGRVP